MQITSSVGKWNGCCFKNIATASAPQSRKHPIQLDLKNVVKPRD